MSVGKVVLLPSSCRRIIISHAQRRYPKECCGFLLGQPKEQGWEVFSVLPTQNVNKERAFDRFLIAPQAILWAEKSAAEMDWQLIGFYHSHPDVPPVPSMTDAEFAIEGYVYLICLMTQNRNSDIRAYEFCDAERSFHEVKLLINWERQTFTLDEVPIDKELNLKGQVSPFTIIQTKSALAEMEAGQVLKVIVDYEPALADVPKAVEGEGHQVLGIRQADEKAWEMLIQRR